MGPFTETEQEKQARLRWVAKAWLGIDGSGKEVDLADCPVAQRVAELERKAHKHDKCQCGQIRATLMVNYGPEGRTEAGIVTENMDTLEMMIVVLRHGHNASKEDG